VTRTQAAWRRTQKNLHGNAQTTQIERVGIVLKISLERTNNEPRERKPGRGPGASHGALRPGPARCGRLHGRRTKSFEHSYGVARSLGFHRRHRHRHGVALHRIARAPPLGHQFPARCRSVACVSRGRSVPSRARTVSPTFAWDGPLVCHSSLAGPCLDSDLE
jgi:hypothetical protein